MAPFDRREALRMLAGSPNGSTKSILLTHGFTIEMLHDLVSGELATAERRTARAGAYRSQMDDDHRRRAAGACRVVGRPRPTVERNAAELRAMTNQKPDKHKEYMHYAEHCLAMAKLAPDQQSRIIQREMAAEWLRLADKVEE
jgi:hypothetical protein